MNMVRIVVLATTCLLIAGCDKKPEQPEPIRPVLSVVVAPREASSLAVVGTVEPQFKTDYGFRMLGRLIARPVNVGDTVEKGQLLAAVDPFAAELAVRSALAEVSTAQGQFVNASGTANRQRTLIETGATTKATLDSAEQSSAAAQAAVTRAQSNLTKAREQLSYTKLEVEYAGVVTAVGVQVGQIVNPGQTVVTVARPDIREAVIDVADELAGMLKIGAPLTVRLQLDAQIEAAGKVREVAPQADPVTRTRRVRITLESPPDTFRLGSTITTLIPGKPSQGYSLPATAILVDNDQSYVWVIDPATKSVSKRKVQIVRGDDGSVQVTDGINAGERIARAGVHQLKEGQRVRLEGEPQA
ncbi:efflux RND transporter periplasmic adaptor subunit [Rhodopseudomonas palustris]|uniref:Efflux RND transporter periplasmic adaptor subunit n=1 Tax=Rhodopseudomonas palustris TaxID=1076 RepID=A0A418V2H9_RHOPL|nr:efflux RND transporter periplasmic adaptor subunit [Rhodopseudomonas palustris]RJF70230.1 efflux RND transporter periplasmic adaptor subunit [Rhodopseudomonas palustris]